MVGEVVVPGRATLKLSREVFFLSGPGTEGAGAASSLHDGDRVLLTLMMGPGLSEVGDETASPMSACSGRRAGWMLS